MQFGGNKLLGRMKVQQFCITCGKSDNIGVCSGCKKAAYCKGTTCQRDDWKTHKTRCARVSKADHTPLQAQASAILDGTLRFNFLNPRTDRTIEKHASDTHLAQKKSRALKSFVSRMGLDPNAIGMMLSDPENVGAYARCGLNVTRVIEKHGGQKIFGWSLYEGRHVFEAEFHVVWLPNGETTFVNVTQPLVGNVPDSGLFVPDGQCDGRVQMPNVIWWK